MPCTRVDEYSTCRCDQLKSSHENFRRRMSEIFIANWKTGSKHTGKSHKKLISIIWEHLLCYCAYGKLAIILPWSLEEQRSHYTIYLNQLLKKMYKMRTKNWPRYCQDCRLKPETVTDVRYHYLNSKHGIVLVVRLRSVAKKSKVSTGAHLEPCQPSLK